MAYKPITGYAGNPALNYAGTAPVSMESPCPYDDWQGLDQTTTYCSLSINSAWIKITATSTAAADCSAYVELFKKYTGTGTLTVAITSNRSAADISFFGAMKVEGTRRGSTLTLGKYAYGNPVSGTLVVPYYRYRIECQPLITNRVSGDWLRADFTLS